MRRLTLSLAVVLFLVAAQASLATEITVTGGTWSEQYCGGGPGQPGNIVSAEITGIDECGSCWTICVPEAVLSSFNGGSGTVADPYDTDYCVSCPPAKMTSGDKVLLFSSLTLNNQTVSDANGLLFTMTTSGTCDAGCYSMCLTVDGVETSSSVDGHCGDITCGTIELTLLKEFEGAWCETFGCDGPGSPGGTLSAYLCGSGWEIDLPSAIHQGVVSGTGTPGDPWISEYQVDPNCPATIKYGSRVCLVSSMTLINENVSGEPLFHLTACGVCDAGCYQIELDICGTVDPCSVTAGGMCGWACGDGSMTLLREFEGTWCETFGCDGPGSPGGTLSAYLCGSGWEIDLPSAIHQGVISGTGTPGDPWVSQYQVDPNYPATIKHGSTVCIVSSMTLTNRNVDGVPTFQMTASGVSDGGCYQIDLNICGTVDMCTVTAGGMCGSACGDGNMTLLKTFEGNWCETFGPCGPGSAGGTLSACLSGGGWTIDLPQAVHQGVIGGSGTPGDPWISEYQVDSNCPPAMIQYGSIICYFSSLTLINENVDGVPTFHLTVSGVCDSGCYQVDLDICGTVDMCTVSGSGMCGSACGDGSLSLLRMFEGDWCETFGCGGVGSPGSILSASLHGSGWAIDLPSAVLQGPNDPGFIPGLQTYVVDPCQPMILGIDSRTITFSKLALVKTEGCGTPTFQLTAIGIDDNKCYRLCLNAYGVVDLSSVTSTEMCGPLCGEATLKVSLVTSSSAGGMIIEPGEKCYDYDYGTTIDLHAVPQDSTFEFLEWEGTFSSNDNPETLEMISCHQVRALFVSLLDVLYVDDDAPSDPGPNDMFISDSDENGTPEHPFDSIQEAIEVAADGATIVVRSGEYCQNLHIFNKSITVTSIDPNGDGTPEFPVVRGFCVAPAVTIQQLSGFAETQVVELVGLVITGGAGDNAGGIACYDSSPIINQCLVIGNRAKLDGAAGVYGKNSNLTLIHCTVADNVGLVGATGGIACVNSELFLGNSIVWSNQPGGIAVDGDSTATVVYSDIQGGMNGEGNIDADPLFVAPGQWTPAIPCPVLTGGDYHLMEGSPAIGAADDTGDMGAYVSLEAPALD